MFRPMKAGDLLPSWPTSLLVLCVLCVLPVPLAGCKKDAPGQEPGGDAPTPLELVYRQVPGSPLELGVPTTWDIEEVDPGPEPRAPRDGGPSADPTALELRSRTLLSVRAKEGALGSAGRPWLMVLHDPFLPAGTTSADYLAAQRASNHQAARMEHVEAERSRRHGRPAYHVRDRWSLALGEREARMSQEALLLLDARDEGMHGYAVVITLLEEDRRKLSRGIEEILGSVRFREE